MNALDIVICVIGGVCLIRGVFRGSVEEITSIVGVFVGFYGAYTYYPLLAGWLSEFITDESYLKMISFILTFVILLVAVGFIGVILKHLLRAAALGWTDRVLGAILALVKAVMIVSVLLVPLTTFLPKNSSVVKDSTLAPYVTIASEQIARVVPKEMKERFRDNVKALKASWQKL